MAEWRPYSLAPRKRQRGVAPLGLAAQRRCAQGRSDPGMVQRALDPPRAIAAPPEALALRLRIAGIVDIAALCQPARYRGDISRFRRIRPTAFAQFALQIV